MKATVRSGLDFYKELGQLRISQGSYTSSGNTPVPGNPYTWNGTKTGGYNIGQTSGSSINSDFLLTGNKSFSKFNVEYLAGGTIFYKRDDNINAEHSWWYFCSGFLLNQSIGKSTQRITEQLCTAG